MRVDGNYGGTPHYEPNSFGHWQEQPDYREPPLKITGDADFWNFREDDADYYKQRHIDNCAKADPAYGAGVAAALAKLAG